MKKKTIIKGPGPKIRRPVQKKANIVMKSKKDYRRKLKYGDLRLTVPEE